jgi:MFS family permease
MLATLPGRPEMMVPRVLAPLHRRSLRLLLIGQVASNVGDACYAVALPWYVLAVHGGTTLLGIVLAAYGIPRTGLILFGGWASDRWGSRAVMLATDAARVAGVGGLAFVAANGSARADFLIPIAVVLGAGEGLFLPASYSILPSLVPGGDLEAAGALTSSGTQLATLLGTATGGTLVAIAGPSLAFVLDAVSFAVSAATLARLRTAAPLIPAATRPVQDTHDATTTGGSAPSTFELIRSQPVLQLILLLTITSNLGSYGVDGVALPSLAHGPLRSGAGGYGLILAAVSVGTLLGSITAGQIRRPRRPGVAGALAFQVGAVAILIAPYLGSTLGVAGAMATNGLALGFGNVLCTAAFQRWAPPAFRGRASGIVMLGIFGVYPVSVALAAIFTRDFGIASFFLFAAITLTVAIIVGLSTKSWRDFGMAEPAATDPG